MRFDIHTHILPSVDDGARDEECTTRMLHLAAVSGTTHIVATPHFACGIEGNTLKDIKVKFNQIRKEWKSFSEKNEFYLGNELLYGEGLVDALNRGEAMTMNETRYVLVEFPVYSDYAYVKRAVQNLNYAGYWPILAHIERYDCLRKTEHIKELIHVGACMQVNADTVLGKNGFFVKHYILKLIKNSLVHFVASDAHSSRQRRPELKSCMDYLNKKVGTVKTAQLFRINPRKMLKGEMLDG